MKGFRVGRELPKLILKAVVSNKQLENGKTFRADKLVVTR